MKQRERVRKSQSVQSTNIDHRPSDHLHCICLGLEIQGDPVCRPRTLATLRRFNSSSFILVYILLRTGWLCSSGKNGRLYSRKHRL